MNHKPCKQTQGQIKSVMIDQLGANCLAQHITDNGYIEFWNVDCHVIVVHAYPGKGGWTTYLPSKEHQLDWVADEIRGYISLDKDAVTEALKPFAHEDLQILLGGNATGDESPVFQRNAAVLKIGDFRRAANVLRKISAGD